MNTNKEILEKLNEFNNAANDISRIKAKINMARQTMDAAYREMDKMQKAASARKKVFEEMLAIERTFQRWQAVLQASNEGFVLDLAYELNQSEEAEEDAENCPYCHSHHELVISDDFKVECRTCGMSGPKTETRADAIEAWNSL